MEFHPKDLPISKTYDLKDEKEAMIAVEDMVNLGFKGKKEGYYQEIYYLRCRGTGYFYSCNRDDYLSWCF